MNLLPQWTDRADKRGLDPLGMQNSGVLLYQSLLPGISNVTLRMRYYGYYCWLSETYARRGATNDFEAWRSWVRRAEALYALVSAQADETGVGGIDWANRRLAVSDRIIDFEGAASTDPSQERYLRQSLGVFGGAYYSQMAEMGLFTLNRHGIQVATRDLGLRAATLFSEAIGPDLAKLLRRKIAHPQISLRDLERLEPIIPSRIDVEGEERLFYETLLFARGEGAPHSAPSRAATLTLILDAARATEEWPDPDRVRWHLFEPPAQMLADDLEAQRLKWEAYQCQDLMQVACAALLAWAIAIINSTPHGCSLPEIRAKVIDHLAAQEQDAFPQTWRDIRMDLDSTDFAYEEAWDILTSARGAPADKALVAIELMAALQQRLADRSDLAAAAGQGLPDRGSAHSLLTEIAWLEQREGEAVADLIADYMLDRVVRRHSWVAMQKLRRQRDYTFLFEQRDNRFLYLSAYQPVATTPRLQPAIQFLADIHLLDENGLTALGMAVLEAAR
ncbi:hypothetical protein [Sphingobium yanoikuyae]|uniref:hypothetical protein n=1 Tax=Sphingobium yanoikuyae TaxID=13690 RepID=UPI0022DD83AD|nr:hypothetical protein [Sphingobium yanoikuyae]WBQ17726.1 hypothetical protein PAE53_05845 [Sphingobium yanoikuyae]